MTTITKTERGHIITRGRMPTGALKPTVWEEFRVSDKPGPIPKDETSALYRKRRKERAKKQNQTRGEAR